MLLAAIGIASIVSIVTSIWALVIIFKRSVLGGVLSLFFGLPILYFLVTGWGKEGEDIKFPFFLNIFCWLIVGAVAFTTVPKMVDEAGLRPSSGGASSFRDTSPASDGARFRETSNTQPMAAPRSSQPPASLRQPVQQAEVKKEAPRRQRAARSDCVYKPVMTDEDIAKCR
jgi:hypothetical protein